MTSEVIAVVLGGKKILGRAIKSSLDLTELIRKGLPAGSPPFCRLAATSNETPRQPNVCR